MLEWVTHIRLGSEQSEVAPVRGALADQLGTEVVQDNVMVTLDCHYPWKNLGRIIMLIPQLEEVTRKIFAALDPTQGLVEELNKNFIPGKIYRCFLLSMGHVLSQVLQL